MKTIIKAVAFLMSAIFIVASLVMTTSALEGFSDVLEFEEEGELRNEYETYYNYMTGISFNVSYTAETRIPSYSTNTTSTDLRIYYYLYNPLCDQPIKMYIENLNAANSQQTELSGTTNAPIIEQVSLNNFYPFYFTFYNRVKNSTGTVLMSRNSGEGDNWFVADFYGGVHFYPES